MVTSPNQMLGNENYCKIVWHEKTIGEARKSSNEVRGSGNVTSKKRKYNFVKEFFKTNISEKAMDFEEKRSLPLFLVFYCRKAVRFFECLQTSAIAWKYKRQTS